MVIALSWLTLLHNELHVLAIYNSWKRHNKYISVIITAEAKHNVKSTQLHFTLQYKIIHVQIHACIHLTLMIKCMRTCFYNTRHNPAVSTRQMIRGCVACFPHQVVPLVSQCVHQQLDPSVVHDLLTELVPNRQHCQRGEQRAQHGRAVAVTYSSAIWTQTQQTAAGTSRTFIVTSNCWLNIKTCRYEISPKRKPENCNITVS